MHGGVGYDGSDGSADAHQSLVTDLTAPGFRPFSQYMLLQERSQLRFRPQIVEEIVGHQCGDDGGVDTVRGVVGDGGLQLTPRGHFCNRGEDADRPGAHRRAALVALRVDLRQELLPVLHPTEELLKACRIALAWMPL